MSAVESGSSTTNATAQGNKEGAEVDVKADGQEEAQVKWGRGELQVDRWERRAVFMKENEP